MVVKVKSEQMGMNPTMEKSSDVMSAIARGVKLRLVDISGFSKMVTHETINIARRLKIDEEEIQKWAAEYHNNPS